MTASVFSSDPLRKPDEPEPWQLEYDDGLGEFPDGIRMSTDCPCRRLREFKAPDEYREFPDHLAARGHGFERIVAEDLRRKGHTVLREVTIPWEHGETHLDFVITTGPLVDANGGQWLVRELKANKEGQPYSENQRQIRRQQRVCERALDRGEGATVRVEAPDEPDGWKWEAVDLARIVASDWRIWVVEPFSWQIRQPDGYRTVYDDEHRAAIDAELDECCRYADMLDTCDAHYEADWPACTCGKCWPPPVSILPDRIARHCAEYEEGLAMEKEGKAAKQLAGRAILDDIALETRLKQQDAGRRRWEGCGWRVSIKENGGLAKVTRIRQ